MNTFGPGWILPIGSFLFEYMSSCGVLISWFSVIPNSVGFMPDSVILRLSFAMSVSPWFSTCSVMSNGSVPASYTCSRNSEKLNSIPCVPPINGASMSTFCASSPWHPINTSAMVSNSIIFFIFFTSY